MKFLLAIVLSVASLLVAVPPADQVLFDDFSSTDKRQLKTN